MQPQQQQNQGKVDNAFTFGLLYVLANAHRTCLTVFMRHSFGTRAFDPHVVVAFGGLLIAAAKYPVFRFYFSAWVFVLIGQRIHSYQLRWKGRHGHSQYQGYPWLAMRWPGMKTEQQAREFEPFLCLMIGGVLLTIHPPLAVFVLAGFLSFGSCIVIDGFVDRRRMQAMRDAEWEMRYYAEKYRQRGN